MGGGWFAGKRYRVIRREVPPCFREVGLPWILALVRALAVVVFRGRGEGSDQVFVGTQAVMTGRDASIPSLRRDGVANGDVACG